MRGCPDPVFVCGCPRSGTTSVWQALLQHPSLSPPPEKQHSKEHWFFVEFFAGRYEHNLANRANELDKIYVGEAIGFINDFMTRHLSSPTGRYLTAHPDNIFYVREIIRHIPKAQFLFLVRHPQENVWSMLNAPFAVEAGWRDSIESTDRFTDDEIRRTTGYWKRSAQVIIDALRGEFGSSVFIIRQEEMIERPIELAREVL